MQKVSLKAQEEPSAINVSTASQQGVGVIEIQDDLRECRSWLRLVATLREQRLKKMKRLILLKLGYVRKGVCNSSLRFLLQISTQILVPFAVLHCNE